VVHFNRFFRQPHPFGALRSIARGCRKNLGLFGMPWSVLDQTSLSGPAGFPGNTLLKAWTSIGLAYALPGL